jgi:hypothetical protein
MHVSVFAGRLLPKTNPYYGEVLHYLKAIHFAHSTEMKNLLVQKVNELLLDYETNGQYQHGKHTTKSLREQYLADPWDIFSIGTHDAQTANHPQHDLPLILPSNQCQESWHKGVMKLLKGQLRGTTARYATLRMPANPCASLRILAHPCASKSISAHPHYIHPAPLCPLPGSCAGEDSTSSHSR